MSSLRTEVKRGLARMGLRSSTEGATILIYHRVGGGSSDELDVSASAFAAQLAELVRQDVVCLDDALDALDRGDPSGRVVLTFDDGFRDVYHNAWPLLRDHELPFTVYLASAFVGGNMGWKGSTARDNGAPALTWDELGDMVESGLCTVGNHTHHHVSPESLTAEEIDTCSDEVQRRLGVEVRHFAYPWGRPVSHMEPALRKRFRSAATGRLGRNLPGCDPMALLRVPVRRTDPLSFYRAKLSGDLFPERAYQALVSTAKKAGARA